MRRFADGVRWWLRLYASLDPRAVGIYRIVLGFLLIADGFRHWSELRFLYSDDGVLTNHFHLWQPSSSYMWSFFHAFSTTGEVQLLFAFALVCNLLLLVGYRPKLFALLSFVLVTSRDARIPLVENGGFVVVNLMCLYAVFLPLSQRFSIDAFAQSWRSRRELTPGELNQRQNSNQAFVSLVGVVIVLNLAAIYFWNVVNKTGQLWRNGTAVHYVLHLDRMVTGVAVFAREHLPSVAISIADWATLSVEGLLCVLILSPVQLRFTRPLAMLLMAALHTTFGVMMRLGPFSWFLIGFSTLLLQKEQFDDLEKWLRRRSHPIELGVNTDEPLAMTLARVLARLDLLRNVTFQHCNNVRLLAVRVPDGWDHSSSEVTRRTLGALPMGYLWEPVLRIATLDAPRRLLDLATRRSAEVTRFCGLRLRASASCTPSPWTQRLRRLSRYPREGLVIFLWLGFASQSLLENRAFPKYLKWEQPKIFAVPINTFRIFQGWGMFAANPIQEDGALVIDALTIDGLRIDPYNGGAPDLNLNDARGLGLSQLRQDYGNRIRLDGNAHYREQLKDHLINRHKRSGNPSDELVSFDVFWLRDKCPQPGKGTPTHNDPVPLATWRKPGFAPPDGFPKIAPAPRTRSAEKWEDQK